MKLYWRSTVKALSMAPQLLTSHTTTLERTLSLRKTGTDAIRPRWPLEGGL